MMWLNIAAGVGTELEKFDLKNAYHMLPFIHKISINWELHGKGTCTDEPLPFGLWSAHKTWSLRLWHCTGIWYVFHYLNDFLLIGAPNTDKGARVLSIALCILQYLGVPVVEHNRRFITQLSFSWNPDRYGHLWAYTTGGENLVPSGKDVATVVQESMYKEGVGGIPGAFVSCCLSCGPEPYLPPPTFHHATPGKTTITTFVSMPGLMWCGGNVYCNV